MQNQSAMSLSSCLRKTHTVLRLGRVGNWKRQCTARWTQQSSGLTTTPPHSLMLGSSEERRHRATFTMLPWTFGCLSMEMTLS